MKKHSTSRIALVVVVAIMCLPGRAPAYSVLTHEQIIDLLWQDQIRPVLLLRFPHATEDDLREAHAFAYGGSLVQDMGYYPFGSRYFSDLVHYVRSGDFVVNLIADSRDLNEYAFAIGALSHYASDNSGHPTINRVVAIEFPKLKRKYGETVTYNDDPKAHIRTEFGFDMVQVAKNRYTSDRYHDFIGFEVAKPLLDRAFQQTYGITLNDVFGDPDLAIGTFRRSVSIVIPEMTRVALLARKKEIVADTPNFQKQKFLYNLSRANYEKDWGTNYRKPGLGTRIVAFFLKIVPKVGPFSAVAFEIPNTQTEDMYITSVNKTVDDYRELVRKTKIRDLRLSNRDFDTGREARVGEYALADKTCARLLGQLAKNDFKQVSPELRENIVAFYSGQAKPPTKAKDKKLWQQSQEDLARLKQTSLARPAASAAAD
jgi:hypothetical protein